MALEYKLNKATAEISELLSAVFTTIYHKTYTASPSGMDVKKVLNELKLLPDSMKYETGKYLETSLGHSINMTIRSTDTNIYFTIIYDRRTISIDACVQAFEAVKEYATNGSTLQRVWLERPYNYYYNYPGTCKGLEKCLPYMTTTDFYEACKTNYDAYIDGSIDFHI